MPAKKTTRKPSRARAARSAPKKIARGATRAAPKKATTKKAARKGTTRLPKRRQPVTLKPVAVTDDGRAVILARRAGVRHGDFRLALDKALVRQLDAAARKRAAARRAQEEEEAAASPEPQPEPRVESKLTPKEIQALLRRGKSVSSIAKRAGVDTAWVERFESPIIWERSNMARRAQTARLTRARSGTSKLPLGEAVSANLRKTAPALGPKEIDAGWDSVRHPRRNTWVVSFTWPGRRSTKTARWEYDPGSEHLEALDKTAADIGWAARARR
ncbi:MAG TPA: septation protein SepH [Actinomycetota bacterium]|nr:septation protein SepH [Actinomycetota bacterium]